MNTVSFSCRADALREALGILSSSFGSQVKIEGYAFHLLLEKLRVHPIIGGVIRNAVSAEFSVKGKVEDAKFCVGALGVKRVLSSADGEGILSFKLSDNGIHVSCVCGEGGQDTYTWDIPYMLVNVSEIESANLVGLSAQNKRAALDLMNTVIGSAKQGICREVTGNKVFICVGGRAEKKSLSFVIQGAGCIASGAFTMWAGANFSREKEYCVPYEFVRAIVNYNGNVYLCFEGKKVSAILDNIVITTEVIGDEYGGLTSNFYVAARDFWGIFLEVNDTYKYLKSYRDEFEDLEEIKVRLRFTSKANIALFKNQKLVAEKAVSISDYVVPPQVPVEYLVEYRALYDIIALFKKSGYDFVYARSDNGSKSLVLSSNTSPLDGMHEFVLTTI